MRAEVSLFRLKPARLGPRTRLASASVTVAPLMCQDPHAIHVPEENKLQAFIGPEVQACRKRHIMTTKKLVAAAGISVGMMSKTEMGRYWHSWPHCRRCLRHLKFSSLRCCATSEKSAARCSSRLVRGSEWNSATPAPVISITCLVLSDQARDQFQPSPTSLPSPATLTPTLCSSIRGWSSSNSDNEITYSHGNTLYHMKLDESLHLRCLYTTWTRTSDQLADPDLVYHHVSASGEDD